MERPDENNKMLPRFGGHCARVSGAQYLSRNGVPLSFSVPVVQGFGLHLGFCFLAVCKSQQRQC